MKLSVHLVGLLPLVLSIAMRGQSIDTTVGGNQTYNAYGLQTNFRWQNLSGWSGLGYSDGFKIGAYTQLSLHNNYIGVGDQWLSGYLDVDEYDTHAFTTRGVSFMRDVKTPEIAKIQPRRDTTLQLFSGFLTEDESYPFLHSSSTSGSNFSNTPMVALLYRRRFSDALKMHAITLYSNGKYTSIESLGWKPSKKWYFAGAAGIGSNSPYMAVAGEVHRDTVEAWASYTLSGKEFHRQELPFYTSEATGFNGRFTYSPMAIVKLMMSSENNRIFVPSYPTVEDHYNTASLYFMPKGFQLGSTVSVVSTNNLPGHTRSEMFSASRHILPRWRVFGAYMYMKSATFKQGTYVATNEFRISPRLNIRQNYNRLNGQNNYTFGGDWISNRLSLSVDNQIYSSPLAEAFGGQSIFQAWTFNLRFRTPGGTNTHLSTYVTPQGKVQWGGYLSGLRYNAVGGPVSTSPNFSKYVIQGKVEDEAGRGVFGIAINIGKDTVISDSDGAFFTHVKNTKPVPFAVAADASIQAQCWTLASAPTSAHGTLEATAEPVRVVVQIGLHNREIAQAGGN